MSCPVLAVLRTKTPAEFYPDGIRGFVYDHVRFCAQSGPKLTRLFFGVLQITYSQDAGMSKDAVPHKDVPFQSHKTKS